MIRLGTHFVLRGIPDNRMLVDLDRLAYQRNNPKEQYKLRNENHHDIITDEMLDCYQSLRYWDLRLLVQGNKIIPVHRLVFASISPLIKRLLQENPDADLIQFPDTNVTDMLIFVRMVYTGFTVIKKRKLEDLSDLIKLMEIQRCDVLDSQGKSLSCKAFKNKEVVAPLITSSKSLDILTRFEDASNVKTNTGDKEAEDFPFCVHSETQMDNVVENSSSNQDILLSPGSENESLSEMIVGLYVEVVDTPHESHVTDFNYKSDKTLEKMKTLMQVPRHHGTVPNVEETTPSIHSKKSKSKKNQMNPLPTLAPKSTPRSSSSTEPLDLMVAKSGIRRYRIILPKSKSAEESRVKSNGVKRKYVVCESMREHNYTFLSKRSIAKPKRKTQSRFD